MTTEQPKPGLAETLTEMLVDHSLVTEHMRPHGVGMVDVKLAAALVAVGRAAQGHLHDTPGRRCPICAALEALDLLVDIGR